METRILNEHYINYVKPMIILELEPNDNNILIPRDFETFSKKNSNIQALNFTVRMCKGMMDYQSYLMADIQLLIDDIDKEIDRLK